MKAESKMADNNDGLDSNSVDSSSECEDSEEIGPIEKATWIYFRNIWGNFQHPVAKPNTK